MPDHTSVGFWVRRFLSEYLVHERGVPETRNRVTGMLFVCFFPLLRLNENQQSIIS